MAVALLDTAVTNTLKITTGAASTSEATFPKVAGLYFVTCSAASYIFIGPTGLSAASSANYTLYLPANFWGLIYVTNTSVRAIQDTAAGTVVFHLCSENQAVGP
jgi:hypothetical protein